MKRIILIAALALGVAFAAAAQPRAIGVRLGYGGEISYQHTLGGANFVEANLGSLGMGFLCRSRCSPRPVPWHQHRNTGPGGPRIYILVPSPAGYRPQASDRCQYLGRRSRILAWRSVRFRTCTFCTLQILENWFEKQQKGFYLIAIKKQVAKSFSGHLFFIASPQKYPHLVISTGGPVDRSGEICIPENYTCCRCLDFARHDTRGGEHCGYEFVLHQIHHSIDFRTFRSHCTV